MKKLILGLVGALVLSSCASTQQAGNLSYADVSLNFSSDEFDIVSLDPVAASATSFFGVSKNVNESAILDRSEFNTEAGTTLGLLTMAVAVPAAIAGGIAAASYEEYDNYGNRFVYVDGPAAFFASAIGIGIAGIINDFSWTGATKAKAIQKCNWALKQSNPNIDSFINPKYDVQYNKSVFGTKCTVTLSAQGVVLKNKK
tara:strand:+ start:154 stop:753 length:600 start_codon:yes stop_codon:yes gene_type:complete